MNLIGTQAVFDPLEFGSREAALKERNRYYRDIIQLFGKDAAHRFTLKDQLRKYSGFGQPDGTVRDVFYVQLNRNVIPAEDFKHG